MYNNLKEVEIVHILSKTSINPKTLYVRYPKIQQRLTYAKVQPERQSSQNPIKLIQKFAKQ